MKIKEIWVSQQDFDDPDPEGLVLGVGGFAIWAMDECGLDPDDFPAVALQSYWADQYLGEVMNGGHKQFAHNTQLSVEAMANTERGLEAFGEVEALATFRSFKAIVANPAIARNLIEDHDYQTQPESISELDAQCPDIFAVRPRHAAWLRTLPILKIIPARELEENMRCFEQAL